MKGVEITKGYGFVTVSVPWSDEEDAATHLWMGEVDDLIQRLLEAKAGHPLQDHRDLTDFLDYPSAT